MNGIIGFILGCIAGYMMSKQDDDIKSNVPIDEAIEVCERLASYEPYISMREVEALNKVIGYAKEQRRNEDDLK